MLDWWKLLKFIYSEKTTIFFEISTLDLSYVVTFKSTVEISQKFVAFSEYMNFKNIATKSKKIHALIKVLILHFKFKVPYKNVAHLIWRLLSKNSNQFGDFVKFLSPF